MDRRTIGLIWIGGIVLMVVLYLIGPQDFIRTCEAFVANVWSFIGDLIDALSVRAFEAKHVIEKTRRGSKRIKAGYETCQFLDNDRRCSVYAARPKDCRGYVCWNQPDTTVYEFAKFVQKPVDKLREQDLREAAKK